MSDLVERAAVFADKQHEGQFRKYTGLPYIVHPAAVVLIVRNVPHTPEMLAAAWLHDVVEDTSATIGQIAAMFGDEVGILVNWLTDRRIGANRRDRVKNYAAWLSMAPAEAQTIKLADMIDNTTSIRAHDPKFWPVYRQEKQDLLAVMTGGDGTLREWAIECAA